MYKSLKLKLRRDLFSYQAHIIKTELASQHNTGSSETMPLIAIGIADRTRLCRNVIFGVLCTLAGERKNAEIGYYQRVRPDAVKLLEIVPECGILVRARHGVDGRMDADSVLQYDSLRRIAQPVLEDGKVVAVGGIVRISNDVELENGRVKRYRLPRSILAFMQVLEYDRSFLASRILFDRFNGSLIISGAFGLFKKDTVIAVGGYDNKTMGEDMELVVKLHEYCTINGIDYAIRYATDAICWTQVPERLRDLCKQRKRWHLGLFQSMYKHRIMFCNYRFGAVSYVSYIYFLIYELLSPFIEVFGVFTMVLAWWCDLINVPFMLLFFLIYAVFGGVLTLTAFFSRIYTADLSVSFRDGVKAVCLCLFELGLLRFILAWVRCTAFVGYKKKKLSWGRIERRKIDLK